MTYSSQLGGNGCLTTSFLIQGSTVLSLVNALSVGIDDCFIIGLFNLQNSVSRLAASHTRPILVSTPQLVQDNFRFLTPHLGKLS